MLKVLVFLFSVFIFSATSAQNYIQYHNLCNEGCQLMLDDKYSEAKEKLLDAISLVESPLSVDYFNLAKCYSRLDAPEITQYYLELSLKLNRRGTKKYIEHSLWFEPVLGKEKWDEMLNANHFRGEPTDIQSFMLTKIDTLIGVSRKYINLYYDSIVVYHPFDSVLLGLYQDSIDINVGIVSQELEGIINDYGWPGHQLTGFNSMDNHFTYVVRAEWFFRMESKLLVEIDKGNLYPWIFIEMADRAQSELKLPCKYNGAFCYNQEVTSVIIDNCKTIGVPLGKVREIRRLN